jgi:formylglycine-generating enzyme required for sulfatase activity
MKRRSYQFKLSLTINILAVITVLFSVSGSLPQTNHVSASTAQEKGGVVKPSPPPPPKPRSTPRPFPQTPTSSGTPRRTTALAKARQTVAQIEVVLIPAGTFMMGSPDGIGGDDEHPQHQVSVKSFYMGKYEVTQAQWRAVMGTNPSHFKGENLPVENISWDDAVSFCRRLSQMTGRQYRLPTEAEWEYACRAGSSSLTELENRLEDTTKQAQAALNAIGYTVGTPDGVAGTRTVTAIRGFQAEKGIPISGKLDDATLTALGLAGGAQTSAIVGTAGEYIEIYDLMAWYLKNSGNQMHPVGQKQPNSFGLYDMHGNVWEWCQDVYHDNYNGAPFDGSAWLSMRNLNGRVLRGGSWVSSDTNLRSVYRNKDDSWTHDGSTGFRVVMSSWPS